MRGAWLAASALLVTACAEKKPMPPVPEGLSWGDEEELSVWAAEALGSIGFEVDLGAVEICSFHREWDFINEVMGVMEGQLRSARPPEYWQAQRLLVRAFRGLDMGEEVVEMEAGMAAISFFGLYDSDRQRVLFRPVTRALRQEKDLLPAHLIVTHEVAHAWQDQSRELDLAVDTTEDIWVQGGLREGEAELLMMAVDYAARGASVADVDSIRLANEVHRMKGIESKPFDPYRVGLIYLHRELVRGGWDGVQEAIRRRPSSEALLHPDRENGEAEPVTLPDWPEEQGPWRDPVEDVLGEWGIRAAFIGQIPLPATEQILLAHTGWDGDRIHYAWTESGVGCLMWRSVWDREEDAEQVVEFLEEHALGSVAREGRRVDFSWSEDPNLIPVFMDELARHPDGLR